MYMVKIRMINVSKADLCYAVNINNNILNKLAKIKYTLHNH